MYIADTKRMIMKAAEYKENMNLGMVVSSLEPMIDGAVIDGLVSKDSAEKLFMDFVCQQTGIEENLYRKLFAPLQIVSSKSFMEQPYLKYIHLPDTEISGFKLERIFYRPCEFVILDEPKMSGNLLRNYAVGMFDGPACSYVLKENDTVWMSVNPMEIRTAEKGIANARGNVLVFGGGLGYFPLMASLKEEVETVTVIEKDPAVCRILNELVIPQIPNGKVAVAEADAFEYIRSLDRGKYNTAYFDIWPDNVTGFDDYKKLVKYEDVYPEIHFDYWLEDSILDTFIINIFQYFSAKLGTDKFQEYFAMVAPDLWKFMESRQDRIERPEQMDYYLTRRYAKEILKKI